MPTVATRPPTRDPVWLRDVTLRDGLQDEPPISTEAKLAIFEALVTAGIGDLELTSFVRPDRVPALADAEQLAAATAEAAPAVTRWGLVVNERGAERALEAGLDHIQFVLSVSEAHNVGNAGRTVAESFQALAAVRAATVGSARLEVTLATAFGCPYTGPVSVDAAFDAVEAALDCRVDGITLADTIGTGAPSEVAAAVAGTVARCGQLTVGVHLHDTRGLALANALAAIEGGAVRIDASLGGLGGCPFAPGASGNVAIEDVAHALAAEGYPLDVDVAGLIAAAQLACASTRRAVDSHVGKAGPRFASTAQRTR